MISAEAADYWRAIAKSPGRPNELRSLSYKKLAGLLDGEIPFSSPITAVCGLSGAGKSALLRAIWAALDWSAASRRLEVRNRLSGAELKAIVNVEGTEAISSIKIDNEDLHTDPAAPIEVLHFDPSIIAASLQQRFCSLQGLPQLLDAYQPIELTTDEVRTIGFVSKKNYQSIRIFEIDEFEGEEVLPFVQVNDDQFEYDSRTMSLGEISILLCFWTLRRAQAKAIFLAEEPETYISPKSQEALMDYFASVCVRKQLFIIFTTHSPQMVARLNEDQVRFFYRTREGSRLASLDQDLTMRRLVGLEVPTDVCVPVEDRAAREFARLLVARADHSLSIRIDIVDVGGHSEITKLRKLVPKSLRSFVLVGVYDGDMRRSIETGENEWPMIFLPGTIPIEQSFQNLSRTHTRVFADKSGRTAHDFEVALAELDGSDHHDWLENLARSLHLSYEQLMMAGFECWYSLEDNKNQAKIFVDELKVAIEGPE